MKLTAHWPNDLEMPKVVHNVQFTITNVQSVLLIGQSVFCSCFAHVLLIDELSNLPPNSYGTLAKRKREKVSSSSVQNFKSIAQFLTPKWRVFVSEIIPIHDVIFSNAIFVTSGVVRKNK